MMKYCRNCCFPDTKPELTLNEDGICTACINSKLKDTIDWNKRKQELKEILENYRGTNPSGYDCIIPVSGGKDSHYQTYVIKKEFGMNPLLVSFHPRDFTELGRKNIENIKNLGVDCIEFTANPLIYKKLAKFGFMELGDSAWPEHIGIFTVPVQVAIAYKIPLLIWGENPQLEYGGSNSLSSKPNLDKEWCEKHGGYFLDKIKPEEMTKYGIEINDLRPYLYPSEKKLEEAGIDGIFLGYYLKWDAKKQVELVKKFGFNTSDEPIEGSYLNYENLDTKHVTLHDYFKFLKYGYGRTTDQVSIDIRNNRMSRTEGLEKIKKFEGRIPKKYLKEFLNEFDLSWDDFLTVCEKFTNKQLFKKDSNGNLLRDNDGNIEKISYDNE